MRFLTRYANDKDPSSPAAVFRRRRFRLLLEVLETIPKGPVRILDLGGAETIWEELVGADFRVTVTLLNLTRMPTHLPFVTSVVGDARSIPQYHEGEFDIVYSNSVIEHLGTLADQRRMADEVRRVGKRYIIQTPSYWFPVEPHFLFPAFHWLPRAVRIVLIQHFSIGWFERRKNWNDAAELVDEIRLMTEREVASLFPEATIWREKVWGLKKSIVAIRK